MARRRKDPKAIVLGNVEKDAEILRGLNGGSKKPKKQAAIATAKS